VIPDFWAFPALACCMQPRSPACRKIPTLVYLVAISWCPLTFASVCLSHHTIETSTNHPTRRLTVEYF
jgi:hypothetical protein